MEDKIERNELLKYAVGKAFKRTKDKKKSVGNESRYTNKAISDRIGIAISSISRVKTGKSNVGICTLRTLVEEGLETDFEDFWLLVIKFYNEYKNKFS